MIRFAFAAELEAVESAFSIAVEEMSTVHLTARITPGPEFGAPPNIVNYVRWMLFPRSVHGGARCRFVGFCEVLGTRDPRREPLPSRALGDFRLNIDSDVDAVRGWLFAENGGAVRWGTEGKGGSGGGGVSLASRLTHTFCTRTTTTMQNAGMPRVDGVRDGPRFGANA